MLNNQQQDEISYLSEERKYKTICSIPKESEEYALLKQYIEVEKLLFSKQNQEKIFNSIISIYEQIETNKDYFLQYLIDILCYFILIRPRESMLSCFLIKSLLTKYENKRNFIFTTIKRNDWFNRSYIIPDVLYSQNLTSTRLIYYEKREDTIFSLYKEGSLEYILKEDDINNLKNYINMHNDFNANEFHIKINNLFNLNTLLPYHNNLITDRIEKGEASILDFCCFYGSNNCFKFLKMNRFGDYGLNIKELCICGGNLEIIHDIEQSGISFDNCFEYSIRFHHQMIKEWLLSNYKCEVFSLMKCFEYYDYEAFLFLLLNEVDINMGGYFYYDMPFKFIQLNLTALGYLCKQYEINNDLIKLLIEHGADINNGSEICTPLGYLYDHKELNIEVIKYLIEIGADIDKGKVTPLGFLCQQKEINFSQLKYLVELGADVNKGDISPLGYACDHDEVNIEVIKYLIDHGAEVNKECIIEYSNICSPLAFLCMQKQENIDAIKLLIEHCADVNIEFKRYNIPYTLLGYLCHKKKVNIEAVKLLIAHGADVNKGETTPLMYSCWNDGVNIEAIKFLIEHGADVNKGEGDHSPLSNLCSSDEINIEAIKLLLSHGADPNKGGPYNPLGYLYLQKEVNLEAMKLLVENGANINQEFYRNNDECPMLCHLCMKNKVNKELLNFIIGADVNAVFGENYTSLSYVCRIDQVNINSIKLLIDLGADVNKGDPTPLCRLCCHKKVNIDAIKILLQHGADVNKAYEIHGRIFTPLCYLCRQEEVNFEAFNLLLKHGADINKGDITPISYLCEDKEVKLEQIQFFLDHGADINKGVTTLLRRLCFQNTINIEAIKFCIEHGSDLNREYDSYDHNLTLLGILCNHDAIAFELIKLLIENGADVNKGDFTPLCYLCKQNTINIEAIKFLVENGADVNKRWFNSISLFMQSWNY